MTLPLVAAHPGLLVLPVAAGLAFGWGYFTMLRHAVAAHAAGGSVGQSIGRLLMRLGAACLFFVLAAHWGAWPLLAAFLGFLGSRRLALRAARSTA